MGTGLGIRPRHALSNVNRRGWETRYDGVVGPISHFLRAHQPSRFHHSLAVVAL
jgi:hypothetical protein